MFLLDTNVVSELRKAATGKADPQVMSWASSVMPSLLFLSAISVLEIELGILSLQRRDALQGAALRSWFEGQVLPAFESRILPVDTDVARRCAALHTPDRRPERDALIAATALVHGFTLVTRNVADFQCRDLQTINPWQLAS